MYFSIPKNATRTTLELFKNYRKKVIKDFGYIPNNWFKFVILRNPIDRLISVYQHRIIEKPCLIRERFGGGSFNQFVLWVARQNLAKADAHIRFQYLMFPEDDMDMIVTLENYDLLMKFFGFKDVLWLNKSKRLNVSAGVKDLIKEIYIKDYHLWRKYNEK